MMRNIVGVLIIIFSCSPMQDEQISYSEANISSKVQRIIFEKNKVTFLNFDSLDIEELKVINEKDSPIGVNIFVLKKEQELLVFQKKDCKLLIFDDKFNNKKSINLKEKLLGGIKNIDAVNISKTKIIMHDKSLRKVIITDENFDEIESIFLPQYSLPYVINSIEVWDDYYVLTGVTINGYEDILKGKIYPNFFTVDENFKTIITSNVLFPQEVKTAIESFDIRSSPTISPFYLVKDSLVFYLFNQTSTDFFQFALKNADIDTVTTLKLPKEIYIRHPNMKKEVYNSSYESAIKWFRNGTNFLNLFFTNDYIIIYLSDFDLKGDMLKFKLIFVEKRSYKIKGIVRIDRAVFPHFVMNNEIFFTGYLSMKEYHDGHISFFTIDCDKLF